MTGRTFELVKAAGLEEMSQAAADFCVEQASSAIAKTGGFTIALTGGKTPRRLYELLASPPRRERINWARWRVFWGDERMVLPENPNSNFRLANESLLRHVPLPADRIHRVPTELGSRLAAAEAYEQMVREIFRLPDGVFPRFDLVLLGLGPDGHIASLFPGNSSLDVRDRTVTSSPPGTVPPPVDRVTFTLPTINAARSIAFLVSGSDKASAVADVLEHHADVPAAQVQPVDGELHWFLDQAAAAQLRC